MFSPLELFVGLRYLRAKRRNHFISFISFVSVFGIALGITVIIAVLSVMNGFQEELRDRILSMTSHANVVTLDGKLRQWEPLAERVGLHEEVVAAAPYVEGQAMMVNRSQVTGAVLRGIDPLLEPQVSEIDQKMIHNEIEDLKAGEFGILLGSELANYLNVNVGEKVTIITPDANITPAGIIPKLRRFTVKGIYNVGMSQYDRNTAAIHIDDAKRLFRLGDSVTGVRLKLTDLFLAPDLARRLNAQFEGAYWVSDWTRSHVNFFRAVQMEKTMMLIIMILIVAVAAFNVVSTLVMVVTDKQADIAILRTLGVRARGILWIFMIQGVVIGLFGTILGIIGGASLALNLETIVVFIEKLMDMKFLSPSVYYISDIPSQLLISDVVLVGSISFLLTVLATLYPAFRAAKVQPAEALRYE